MTTPSERAKKEAHRVRYDTRSSAWLHLTDADEHQFAVALDAFAAEAVRAEREAILRFCRRATTLTISDVQGFIRALEPEEPK